MLCIFTVVGWSLVRGSAFTGRGIVLMSPLPPLPAYWYRLPPRS